jgi:hypothetical protein
MCNVLDRTESWYTKFEQELFRNDVFYPAEAGVGGFHPLLSGQSPRDHA